MARHILESALKKCNNDIQTVHKAFLRASPHLIITTKSFTKEATGPWKSLARIQVSWYSDLFSNIL